MQNSTMTTDRPAEITAAEREFAAFYLAATRDYLLDVLKDLSDAQWNFKPAADRWSIAETMDHMAIVEERIQGILGQLAGAPADAPDRDVKRMDARLLVGVPMRYPRFKAPDRIAPVGGRTGRQALEQFVQSRAKTIEGVASFAHLRGRVMPHPVFGPIDGFQWIIAASGHCARHTGQILEVKHESAFPAA